MGRVIIWTSATVLFLSLVTATILANLLFLPVLPDLVLLVVVYVSFMNSAETGCTTGVISGILLDFLSASPIGLNAFTKTITGYAAGKLAGSFNLDRILIPFAMGVAATLIKAVSTWVLSLFFGPGILLYKLSGSVFWLEVAANGLCAPFVFAFLGFFPGLFIARSKG